MWRENGSQRKGRKQKVDQVETNTYTDRKKTEETHLSRTTLSSCLLLNTLESLLAYPTSNRLPCATNYVHKGSLQHRGRAGALTGMDEEKPHKNCSSTTRFGGAAKQDG